jgi:alpha-N-arabinofuranosidase
VRTRSPTGVLRQTIFHPLKLFAQHVRGGTAVRVALRSATFAGETLPRALGVVRGPLAELDASAVRSADGRALVLAVVNRAPATAYAGLPVRVAFAKLGEDVEVHELWHEDLKARNMWGEEEQVKVVTRKEKWTGAWTFREHSFTMLVFRLE